MEALDLDCPGSQCREHSEAAFIAYESMNSAVISGRNSTNLSPIKCIQIPLIN
jgi:hypothetical protein